MLNWLVTGGSGFVGRALLEELLEISVDFSQVKKCKLVSVCRTIPSKPKACVEYLEVGDLAANLDKIDWGRYLRNIDIIVHAAARVHVFNDPVEKPLDEFRRINVNATLDFARRAVRYGVKRFIFLSSVGVNGQFTTAEEMFTEEDIPCPHNDYARSKYEAEMGLCEISKETGLEIVIIRPPLVYGVNAPGNFELLSKAINRGIPLPFGSVKNQRSLVFIGNLVNFIVMCGAHPQAANQTFLVSDGQDLSTAQLIRKISLAAGKPDRVWNFNMSLLKAVAALTGKSDAVDRVCSNLQVDISKARNLLGWVPPYSVDEGIALAVKGTSD